MRLTGPILAIVLLAPSATSQVSPPSGIQPQFTPEQFCTVEGNVLNSLTGEPVRKVAITLSSFEGHRQARQHTTITDINGHFLIGKVEPGSYSLQAGGGGIPYQIYGQQFQDHHLKVISLEAGQSEKGIVFRIAPGAVIAGTVYDEDGDPVIDANVQAYATGGISRRGGPGGSAQTNDRGEYRVFGLDAGKYLLMAQARNQNEDGDDLYLPTFYPGTSDEAQASPVEVQPGDEMAAINLILSKAHGVRVRGRIINAPMSKNSMIYVQLIPGAPESKRVNLNYGAPAQDEKGNFEIKGVPPGSYFAVARFNDAKNMLAGRTPVEVTNVDVDNVVVVLNPSIGLSGRVRTESGAPLDFSRLRIWLQPTENRFMGGGGAEMKPDGTFVIHNLFDGTYRLHVGGHPEEFYVKSARLGDSDILASGLTLSGGQAPGTVQIEMSRNGGTISGTVLNDSKPVPGAWVVLVPDPPNRDRDDLYNSKPADQFGRFTMLGLPPGDFKIFAWDSALNVNIRDPEFLKSYEDRGQSVHVEQKHQQTVQVELITPKDESQ
ncbi:MAG TPA: carboxypeptidase-like regulatory domain-containing protein [Terriglobia bacterium]|nr:carboxypeptidase-like regulatory domain-containing protein [Terriglobia bacterium]